MRLALSLRRTLVEMSELSGNELAYWLEFMKTEPIGHQREDINFALLRQQIASLAGTKNTKVSDYLFDYWGNPAEQEGAPEPPASPEAFRAAFSSGLQGLS